MHRYLQSFSFYKHWMNKRKDAEDLFYINNRIRVLDTYRFFMKTIPKIYPRDLQQVQKINEVRWIYKTAQSLPNLQQTAGRTQFAVQVVEQLKKGKYSGLGDFVPRYRPILFADIENFLEQRLPDKKKWFRGHIH